jgi:hypothetical protein
LCFTDQGPTANRPSLEIYRELLAGYAMHTTTASLMGSSGSPIRNDLARLNGARFVSAVEIGMGKKLDEALVKQLTGGDQVTARFLYNEFFEYKPEFKLFIAANHKPDIQGVDHGIWRRIHLIPFDVTIPTEEIDRDLPSKLRAELPGILAWAVQGCREWQEQGLNVPASISSATAAYRAEMDIIAEFLTDCCTLQASEKTPWGLCMPLTRSGPTTLARMLWVKRSSGISCARRVTRNPKAAVCGTGTASSWIPNNSSQLCKIQQRQWRLPDGGHFYFNVLKLMKGVVKLRV